MIINGQRYEAEPAVEAYVKDLQAENEEQRREILRLTDALKEADEVEAFLREKGRHVFVNAARFCETIAKLKAENAQLEEKYQKATGVIATDGLPTAVDLYKLKKKCAESKTCRGCEYLRVDYNGFEECCALTHSPCSWNLGGAE